MNWRPWRWVGRVPGLLAVPRPEPAEQAHRILTIQRDMVLPAKLVVIGVVFYYLYFSRWVVEAANTYGIAFEMMQDFFGIYILLNLLVAVSFFVVRRFPAGAVQWTVFVIGAVDGLFLGGLTLLTGGFDSMLYWFFPGLIVLNALCIPLATPQIVLNLMLSAMFLGAGLLETDFRKFESGVPYLPRRPRVVPLAAEDVKDARLILNRLTRGADPLARLVWNRFPESTRQKLTALAAPGAPVEELQTALAEELNRLMPAERIVVVSTPESDLAEDPTEPFLLRLAVLWMFTACCYGVQVLAARQRLAEEEQKEFTARTEQLRSAGRLAAEFAHQIKNPLAIINNAAFSLRRAVREGRGDPAQQIQIIQEEVEKSDRIITQIMGYAQLNEGRVEKLEVIEELDRALDHVFPPGAEYGTRIQRDYESHLPPLLMQRGHLMEIFVNLLQNAREVLEGKGHLTVIARAGRDSAVEVVVSDDGPGIAADKLERVFEAYYSTKPKGTGLGLAIVKHNVELYGGTVRVESELGKGARFSVSFPSRTAVKLPRQP